MARGLVVTLWMADQIEMDLFMAFVVWLLIAVRTVFGANKWVVRGTVVGFLLWAIILPFFHDSGSGFIEDMTLALAYTVMALGLNIIVGFAGLLDLGYVAFYALGALTSGWFMSGFFVNAGGGEGWSFLVGEPASNLPGIHLNFLLVLGDRGGGNDDRRDADRVAHPTPARRLHRDRDARLRRDRRPDRHQR